MTPEGKAGAQSHVTTEAETSALASFFLMYM